MPTILVIVGISGDLSRRKLLPAIREIAEAGKVPEKFKIVGITRQDLKLEDILPKGDHSFLKKRLSLLKMNLTEPEEYDSLESCLNKIEDEFGGQAQRLFYLSIPPQAAEMVIEHLGKAGFGKQKSAKLLLEKPFGTDLASAEDLVERIKQYFNEDQVFRIDHYLAKEMAQNILVFRTGNSLFKRSWDKEFIERIEIVSSEKIGIEGRGIFYEQTGALRDVVQSHLMQLAALTLMDTPRGGTWEKVPKLRLAALESLLPPKLENVCRGQYKGYTEEIDNPHSAIETFASLTLESSDERWAGVPIKLTTGKSLDQKCTEIRIHYRQKDSEEANQLKLQIQPHEGIELDLWSKKPGLGRELEQVKLQFDFHAQAEGLTDAYEQVFLDAIQSNHSLFTTSEEVLESWRILAPVQSHWNMTDDDLIVYEPGSTPEEVAKKKKTPR